VRKLRLGLSNATDDGKISWAQIQVKIVVSADVAQEVNPTSRPPARHLEDATFSRFWVCVVLIVVGALNEASRAGLDPGPGYAWHHSWCELPSTGVVPGYWWWSRWGPSRL